MPAHVPDYDSFSADEFTFDPAFQQWINAPTPETDQFWSAWLAKHPHKQTDVSLARQVVLALAQETPRIDHAQIEHDVDRLLQRVQRENVRPLRTRRSYGWWAAAAALLLTIGLGWLTYKPGPVGSDLLALEPADPTGTPVYTNTTRQQALVSLPDGTTVTLAPGSTLRHEMTFGQATRTVALTGEAFFNVVRNEAVPFRVVTDEIVTRVLGTSFRVSAYQDRQLTVAVRTGKVSVYKQADETVILANKVATGRLISLTPNQAVQYSRRTHTFHKTLVNNPVPVGNVPAPDAFVFDETPINEVFDRLEKTYGIPIDYDATRLRDCKLTASLNAETLTQKLTLICKALEGHYELVDGTIVIQSSGCR